MIAFGFVAPAQPELPNIDKRVKGAVLSPAQQTGAAQLRARIPAVQVDTDDVRGSPAWVMSTEGFLSGPPELEIRRAGQLGLAPNDPHRPIKAFIVENAALFGHGLEVLTNDARIKDDYVTPHSGMRSVVWEQQLDGIPVFEGLLIGHVTQRGELVNLSSHFLPNVVGASQMDSANRGTLETKPPVSAQRSVANAATNIGETLRAEDVTAVSVVSEGPDKRQNFAAAPLAGEAQARLVWLPMNRTSIRLCWSVELVGRSRGEMFRVLIDAQTGEALIRHCLTAYQSQASSYRVFTSDSPTPFSPGHPAPSSVQPGFPCAPPDANPPLHCRDLVTVSSSLASPNGWINDGFNYTLGNNADARLDRANNNLPYDDPAAVRPAGSPYRVFEFDMDLAQEPTVNQTGAFNQNAAVVNLFYWNNWMHDRLYDLGFVEGARNFQQDNFGRGGQSGDAVLADAQDVSGFNNANFATPQDGNSPRMQMYLWDQPTPDRDGDLDAEVILHEYTHGLSNRRVGGGVGITALQSRGMGEGWSDFYALALLSEAADNVHGNYAMGGYVTYLWGGILTENYYFGIRRYPYTTALDRNPLTFKDIDPNQIGSYPLIRRNPNIPFTPSEASVVHRQGEVWCVALWEAKANLVDRYGWQVGNDLILRLVTDGMNLSPANPTFIQARDAILQADRVYTGGANLNELWAAFARRGMGWGATAPASSTTVGVVETFALPPRGNQVWAGPYITGGAISGSPAIAADGTIYAGSWDGKIYAINPIGTTRWIYPSSGSILDFRGSPSVGPSGTIYIGCLDNRLYSISPSGTLLWSHLTGGQIHSSPGFGADGTVYFGSRDGKVYALDPSTGGLRTGWPVTVGGFVDSSPAVAPDGTIYIGAQSSLYAFLPSGAVKAGWPKATGGTVLASPAIDRDGTVYITSQDGKLYALNPDGTTKWTFTAPFSIRSSPAISPEGTNIFFGTDGGTVYAISPSGASRWMRATGSSIDSSPAVDAFGNVIIGSWNGFVYALRPDNGLDAWPPFSTGAQIQSPPVLFTNGVVYIGNAAGRLYALSNLTGAARSTWPMFRQNPRHTANPATLTLASGVRLGDFDFQFQIRGLAGMNCTVEGSHNLESWSTLGSVPLPAGGVATFTDTQASGYPHRFYRVRSDSILSYNSLGYMAVDVPSGDSMIANQLDHPAGNTLGVLLPNPPEGTTLSKWDEATQQLIPNDYQSGQWTDPNMTLNPGEGALVQPGTATTFTFVGDLRQGTLANPYPSNFSVRSSMVPQTGPLDTALGFQPVQEDLIYRWNNEIGDWDLYTFAGGTWHPTVPIPRVGESFMIYGTASTWTRTFSIW